MKVCPELISELASKANLQRVQNKTHNFLGPENTTNQLKNGKHPSQNKEIVAKRTEKLRQIAKEGNLSLQRQDVKDIVSSLTSERNKAKSLKNELYAQNQPIVTCPYCGKVGKRIIMMRWHFSKCQLCS